MEKRRAMAESEGVAMRPIQYAQGRYPRVPNPAMQDHEEHDLPCPDLGSQNMIDNQLFLAENDRLTAISCYTRFRKYDTLSGSSARSVTSEDMLIR